MCCSSRWRDWTTYHTHSHTHNHAFTHAALLATVSDQHWLTFICTCTYIYVHTDIQPLRVRTKRTMYSCSSMAFAFVRKRIHEHVYLFVHVQPGGGPTNGDIYVTHVGNSPGRARALNECEEPEDKVQNINKEVHNIRGVLCVVYRRRVPHWCENV